MKEFTTALKRAEVEDDEGQTFKFDGRECRYYIPDDGQIAVLMSAMGRRSNLTNQVAGAIDFFTAILDEDDRLYFTDRLMDRRDPFGIGDVTQIMQWLVEEWTGRPTQPSSDSSPSRATGGRKSKPTTTKST